MANVNLAQAQRIEPINRAREPRTYHNFTSELLVELNTIRATAAGAAALVEQIADETKAESVYVQELMYQVRRQLDTLATKIDGATYDYVAKA